MRLAGLALPLLLIPAAAQNLPAQLHPDATGLGLSSAISDLPRQMLSIRRVHVDRLTGGESAAQIRELIIASLQNARLFVVTENPDRADAFVRGAAEDLIYTDQFVSSNGINVRGAIGRGARANDDSAFGRAASVSVGDQESTNIRERKHEALATVRLVNKDGDVLWSTTQESNGAKFRGASADVAEKIVRALVAEYNRLRQHNPVPSNGNLP
jgi:hypothetical protein